MEYILSIVAGMAMFFLVILLIYNRRQGVKIKKSIQEIKKIQTGSRNNISFFE